VCGNPYPKANLGFSLPSPRGVVAMINCMTGSVLIVDDDPTFRRMAARMIVAIGLAVVGEAETAAAAVAAAVALRPDAVLLDVRLPDGDGVALARELTSLPWRPRVVLTSSDIEAATASEVHGSGAHAFVPKVQLPNAELGELLGGTPH
jgi:DNA-binding NarL/FixJ family response regulator